MGFSPNHARIDLEKDPLQNTDDIYVNDRQIGQISASAPVGSEFDLVMTDSLGQEHYREHVKMTTQRWGKRVDLLTPDSRLKVKIESPVNAKLIDIFVD